MRARGEDIVRALRCTGTVHETVDCTDCPYLLEETVPEDMAEALGSKLFLSCDVDQIALDAAEMLENDESQAVALQRELALRQAQLDCAVASSEKLRRQNGELRDAAAHVTRLAAEAAVERDWIRVEDRLPEDRSDVLVVAYWHERWGVYMGWCAPERAAWSVHIGIGDRADVAVTHWMPLPEPPKEGM